MTYTELKVALYLFGFHENDLLSIKRIKQRHRNLVRKAHPDLYQHADPERIRQLNEAARIIMEYVNSYRFSFTQQEFYRQKPDEYIRTQYAYDPIWAGQLEQRTG